EQRCSRWIECGSAQCRHITADVSDDAARLRRALCSSSPLPPSPPAEPPRWGRGRKGPSRGSNNSADCYERGPAIFGVRVAPGHDEPRSGPNSSERESTSSRSTDCGSGRLIRVFRDTPVACWSPADGKSSKPEDGIWFRRRQKRFHLCFLRNFE